MWCVFSFCFCKHDVSGIISHHVKFIAEYVIHDTPTVLLRFGRILLINSQSATKSRSRNGAATRSIALLVLIVLLIIHRGLLCRASFLDCLPSVHLLTPPPSCFVVAHFLRFGTRSWSGGAKASPIPFPMTRQR